MARAKDRKHGPDEHEAREIAKQGLPPEHESAAAPIFEAFLTATRSRELAHAATEGIQELVGKQVLQLLAPRFEGIESRTEALAVLVRELLRLVKERGLTWDLAQRQSKQERAQTNEALFRMIDSLCDLIDSVRQEAQERDAARGVVADAQAQAIRSLEKAVESLNRSVQEQGAAQRQQTKD